MLVTTDVLARGIDLPGVEVEERGDGVARDEFNGDSGCCGTVSFVQSV